MVMRKDNEPIKVYTNKLYLTIEYLKNEHGLLVDNIIHYNSQMYTTLQDFIKAYYSYENKSINSYMISRVVFVYRDKIYTLKNLNIDYKKISDLVEIERIIRQSYLSSTNKVPSKNIIGKMYDKLFSY
jgi:hypothetical protein